MHNKKIGIWGLGIVGKSILKYVTQFTNQIQLMDQHPTDSSVIEQSPESITQFLQHNDIIFASPGIRLHDYQNFAHKFLCELDIFAQQFHGQTIAITGTVGKTTITHLLATSIPRALAAGNIGHAMLNVLDAPPSTVILELSSYQLHYTTTFAPDIAIWTNFYPNHLDHHADEQEYFSAKCNILRHQTKNQIALLPYDLIEKIEQSIKPRAQIYLFYEDIPKTTPYPTLFTHNNQLLLKHNNQTTLIFDNFHQLPDITFAQNWIIILATLHLRNIPFDNFLQFAQNLKPQEHRLEFVKTCHGVQIYNDSKSTVWQATKQAVDKFVNQRIALFLGGLSKGTDRTPLIAHLTNKNITVFAFGKESEIISNLCKKFQIAHESAPTLQDALTAYQEQQTNFDILLFSPAGASFDLFKNFEDRGTQFKKMIEDLL